MCIGLHTSHCGLDLTFTTRKPCWIYLKLQKLNEDFLLFWLSPIFLIFLISVIVKYFPGYNSMKKSTNTDLWMFFATLTASVVGECPKIFDLTWPGSGHSLKAYDNWKVLKFFGRFLDKFCILIRQTTVNPKYNKWVSVKLFNQLLFVIE